MLYLSRNNDSTPHTVKHSVELKFIFPPPKQCITRFVHYTNCIIVILIVMHYKICHDTNFPLPLLPMLAKVHSSSKINVIPACIPWILSFRASSHQKIQSGLICMVREEIV